LLTMVTPGGGSTATGAQGCATASRLVSGCHA
ncbi:MAG: hypothetical protein RJA59_788, partial [Pseudomonadota bacterium]